MRTLADSAAAHRQGVWLCDAGASENLYSHEKSVRRMLAQRSATKGPAGKLRLWARGFASLDEAKQRLDTATEQYGRLLKLQGQWRQHEQLLDEALVEVCASADLLEALPALRPGWESSASAARALADTL